MHEPISRRKFVGAGGLGLAAMGMSPILAACGSSGDDGDEVSGPVGVDGIPTKPFDPNVSAGATPDLPARMGFAIPVRQELYQSQLKAMQLAADERGIEVLSANADGNSARHVENMNSFLSRRVAGLVLGPVEAETETPVQQRAIDEGLAVMNSQNAPSTSRYAGIQEEIGRALGDGAAQYIEKELGGEAKVAYFSLGHLSPNLKVRDDAVIRALESVGGGVEINVQSSKDVSADTGLEVGNAVLKSEPDTQVWLGPDAFMPGVLAAIEAANAVTDETFVGGIDGESAALDKIRQGTAYKLSIGFNNALIGYAWAHWTADWLEGKSIPLAAFVSPIPLRTTAQIDAFEAAGAVDGIADSFARIGDFIKLVGNTSYEENRYTTEDF